MALRLELDAAGGRAFCTRWKVAEFAVFGSVTGDDFRPDSDLDVLVSPEPGATWSLMDLGTMREEVIELAGRPVDLIVRRPTPHAVAELARRISGTIAGVIAPVATAEDVIIAKLAWARDTGSERQLADVAGIVRLRRASLDHAYLERWITDLDLGAPWARARALAAP